jgi:predicted nucleic acid-binding protein
MKKIFVDTNIIIDLLADRKPYSKFAVAIFSKAEKKKIQLFASSHSIATVYYMMKKYTDEETLRNILSELLDFITVIPIDVYIIKKGLKSNHKDFEDALQILSALTIEQIDGIVTRNLKDFKLSEIPVYSPDKLVFELAK